MARVLLTGSSGGVGRAALPALESAGWTVRCFDIAEGQDLRDEASVRKAVTGCDAIVHAGAIPHDTRGTPADIVATNVQGTWHVLLAAEAEGVDRVVYFSSAQVFGCSEGEGTPAYLPIDDAHPLRRRALRHVEAAHRGDVRGMDDPDRHPDHRVSSGDDLVRRRLVRHPRGASGARRLRARRGRR